MSDFFDSEIVQEELEEINEMQQDIYKDAFTFPSLSREDRKEHIESLKILLDKQRVMYTRLSLSDDPTAKELKSQIEKSVTVMGFKPGTSMDVLFDTMSQTIQTLEGSIDRY
tara:strand:+ start:139 stop:474 length:336 start_codon:yes stop_codon:yes gene_type:complete